MTETKIITQWYKIAEHHHSAFFGAFELYRVAVKVRGHFRIDRQSGRAHGGHVWYVVSGDRAIYNGKPYKCPNAPTGFGSRAGLLLRRDSFQEAKDAFDIMINQPVNQMGFRTFHNITSQAQPFVPKKDPEIDIMIEIMCIGIGKIFSE